MGGFVMFKKMGAACLALFAGLFLASSAMAGGSLFDGKTITYIVATKPGGGYDTMGRLVAKYLEKHLKGSRVVIKNVPGAGHLIGAKTIFAAKPDGLTIGTFNTSLINSQLTNAIAGHPDMGQMSWIGKAAVESRVLVVSAKSEFKTFDEFRKSNRTAKMASSGKGSASHIDGSLLAKAFDLNVEFIHGFEGSEAEMSILRGEIDGHLGSRSSLQPFVDNGYGRILLEIGGEADSGLPQASDLATTGRSRAILALIEAQARISRLTAGPGGMDPKVLQALREAYMSATADPEFLAEADKLKLPISPASGEAVTELVKTALAQSPEIVALLKEVLKEE
jgi:tripartite-type tricarboxylate transporter receptor subunit TctC